MSNYQYERLSQEDSTNDPIIVDGGINYIPAGLGSYDNQGLAYKDNQGQAILIPHDKIPIFLENIYNAGTPWNQHLFATLFYGPDQKTMPGFETFQGDLQKNPAALVHFNLMLLASRAADIQIARVGAQQNVELCDDSKALLELYHKLHGAFKAYQDKIQTGVYSDEDQNQFNIEWKALLLADIEKYQHKPDIHNIILNLLAIATIIGLAALIYKNAVGIYKGKNPALFQFGGAYSKNVNVIERLRDSNNFLNENNKLLNENDTDSISSSDFEIDSDDDKFAIDSTPLNINLDNELETVYFNTDILGLLKPREGMNLFTKNIEDAESVVCQVKRHLANFKQSIQDNQPVPRLVIYSYKWLIQSMNNFEQDIKKIKDHKNNDCDLLELAEARFITEWVDTRKIIDLFKYRCSDKLKNSLSEIQSVADQMEHEFSNSNLFSTYVNQSNLGQKK